MFILFYETPVKMEGLVFKDPLCPYLFFKSVCHFLTSFHCYYYYSTVTILRLFYFFMECLGEPEFEFLSLFCPKVQRADEM